MKIIYVLNDTTLTGGGNKSFLNMLEVVRTRHEALVVCPDGNDITPYLRSRGVPVEVLSYIYDIRPDHSTLKDIVMFVPRLVKRELLNFIASRKLTNIARCFGADLIHTNTSVTDIGYRAARHLGLPHLLHVREYGDKDFGMHIYGLSNRLYAPDAWSVCITADISRHRGLDANPRSEVVYNPILTGEMRYTADKQPYFLYAGRIEPAKGIDDLIQAYIAYAEGVASPLPLKIAGSFESDQRLTVKNRCEAMLAQASLSDSVLWLGQVSDVADLMYRARAIIIPSRFEGFGRVMPEALANGCLPIGRDTGGTHEQFENGLRITGGEIGLRFTTIDDLTRQLTEVADNPPEFYRPFIDRGRDTIARLYTTRSSGEHILRLYDHIINETSSGK